MKPIKFFKAAVSRSNTQHSFHHKKFNSSRSRPIRLRLEVCDFSSQPKLISSFDGIASADLKGGSVFAVDDGTVAFMPKAEMFDAVFDGDINTAALVVDIALESRGLRWGTVHYGRTRIQSYVSRLSRDAASKYIARTPERIAQLAEVVAAFEAGSFERVLTPEALKVRAEAMTR